MTLHRANYRERVSPRIPFAAEVPSGGTRGPCVVGSLWENFAFNDMDMFKTIEVTGKGGKFELRVDKILRAVVDTWTVDVALKP